MNIAVIGYFDSNFGDDRMVELLLDRMSNNDIITLVNLKGSNDEIDIIGIRKKRKINDFIMYNEFIGKLYKYESIIKIGGGLFGYNTINYSLKGLYSYRVKKRQLKKMRKSGIPYYIIGSNIEKPTNNLKKKLLKQEMGLSKSISLRDSYSNTIISSMVEESKLFMFPDILFSENLTSTQIERKSENSCILGISIFNQKVGKEKNIFFIEKTTEIIDEFLLRDQSNKVNLYCFDGNRENDTFIAYNIQVLSKYSERIEIVPYIQDTEIFTKRIKESNYFIGIRFHSIVLAMVLKIPLLPLVYSTKTNNLLEDIDYNKHIYMLEEFINLSKSDVISLAVNEENYTVFEVPDNWKELSAQHFNFHDSWI